MRSNDVAATPVAPSPTVTRTTSSATSVILSGTRGARSAGRPEPFTCSWWTGGRSGAAREPQRVPDAADGVQQPGLGGVDLAPQVGDVGLDDVGLAVEVVVPH